MCCVVKIYKYYVLGRYFYDDSVWRWVMTCLSSGCRFKHYRLWWWIYCTVLGHICTIGCEFIEVDALCCKEVKSVIATEEQTAMKLSFSTEMYKFITQAVKYLHCGTQDYSELFPKLSNDITVKIILRLIKRHSPPANDELNSTLEVQHGVGHQFSASSFENKKLPDPGVKAQKIWLKMN